MVSYSSFCQLHQAFARLQELHRVVTALQLSQDTTQRCTSLLSAVRTSRGTYHTASARSRVSNPSPSCLIVSCSCSSCRAVCRLCFVTSSSACWASSLMRRRINASAKSFKTDSAVSFRSGPGSHSLCLFLSCSRSGPRSFECAEESSSTLEYYGSPSRCK